MKQEKVKVVESLIINFKKIRILEAKIFNKQKHNKQQIPYHHLMILHQLIEEGPIPISRIKKEYNISASAATQFVKNLERSGYIVRVVNPSDHRSYLISLSKKGMEAVKNSTIESMQIIEKLVDYLGVEDTQTLQRIIDKTLNFYYNLEEENE